VTHSEALRPSLLARREARSAHPRSLALTGLAAATVLALSFAGVARAANVPVPCSVPALVTAISAANGTPAADTLNLASGCTYRLVAATNDANGLPTITSDITLNGRGATIARAASAPRFRILDVASGGALTLDSLTVSGGIAADCPDPSDPGVIACGGGILTHGALTVILSRISNNTATSAADGGIFVEGGGIESIAGIVILRGSTISGNTASYTGTEPGSAAFGGGVSNETTLDGAAGSLTIDQSQLVGNTVSATGTPGDIGDGGFAEGGALVNYAPATIDRSAISNNRSVTPDSGSSRAAGILNAIGASMAVSRSLVTGNNATANNGEALGGGIENISRSSTLSVTDSIVNANTLSVTGVGGGSAIGAGIDNSSGTLTVVNTTLGGNSARATDGNAAGGGMRNNGTASLTRVIVSGNSISGAAALGGGIRNSGAAGPLTLTQSLVIHNTASGLAPAGGGISDATLPTTVTLTGSAVFGNSPDNCSPLIPGCS
jgi:hypothetical protein